MPPTILEEAQRIVGNAIPKYGHPSVNFTRIGHIWTAQLERKLTEPITAADVGLMMIGLKLARAASGTYHQDNLTDMAGYAYCVDILPRE